MVIYIRGYLNYCFELIITEGKKFKSKKKRIHILINPNNEVNILPGKSETEVNTQSITHILSMQTSIINSEMIKRTVTLAENTNKPVITNKKSSLQFRELGISVKQLRILGYDEEVIDGLSVDPVYMEEIDKKIIEKSQSEKKNTNTLSLKNISKFGKKLTKNLNPLNLGKNIIKIEPEKKIDPTNPMAIVVYSNNNKKIMIPLDDRGIKHIQQIINSIKPWVVIMPEMNISDTYNINNTEKLIFMNKEYKAEEMMLVPRSSNPTIKHQTLLCGFNTWYKIPS